MQCPKAQSSMHMYISKYIYIYLNICIFIHKWRERKSMNFTYCEQMAGIWMNSSNIYQAKIEGYFASTFLQAPQMQKTEDFFGGGALRFWHVIFVGISTVYRGHCVANPNNAF